MIDKKLIIFGMCMFLIIISSCSREPFTILDSSVFVDDSNVYINVTPHTISHSGWVEAEFESKEYSGNVDFVFGFNTEQVYPTRSQIYNPHNETTWYDYTCDGTFDYTTNPNYFWCYDENESIIFEHSFEYGNLALGYANWSETEEVDWVNWNPTNSIYYDFAGMNKWYYAQNKPIQEDVRYKIRYYLELPGNTNGKYTLAIKPSGETIQQAIANGHFYMLDPWWEEGDLLDDLLHYYDFNTEGLAEDIHDGNENGTLTGSPTFVSDCLLGGCYNYSDNTEYIDYAVELVNESESFSISGWGMSNSATGIEIFYEQTDAGATHGFGMGASDTYGLVTHNDVLALTSDETTATARVWHHYVYVYDLGGTPQNKYYIDRVLQTFEGSENASTINTGASDIIRIGGGRDSNQDFVGAVDEMAFWNRTLSQAEVDDLYNDGDGLEYGTVSGEGEGEGVTISGVLLTPTTAYSNSIFNCSGVVNGTESQLVFHWKMNDDASNTTVIDSIGNYNGTAQQNTENMSVEGKINNALYFNGSDRINTTYDASGETELTISYWMKKESGKVLSIGQYGGGDNEYNLIWHSDNKLYAIMSNDGVAYGWTEVISSFDEWTMATLVFKGSLSGNDNRIKIYVNETQQELTFSGTIPASIATIDNTLVVGRYGTSTWSNGSIDEVRVYDTALTQSDISNLYNSGSGTEEEDYEETAMDLNVIFTSYNNSVVYDTESRSNIPSETSVNATEIFPTPLNVGDQWHCSIYAEDPNDSSRNATANSSIVTILNIVPTFDHTATNWSDWHSTNISMDINCTDIDEETITYNITSLGTTLSTPLTINGSNGLIYNNPTIYDVGNYAYNISCSDATVNITQVFNLTVKQNVLHSINSSKLALLEGEDIIFYLKVNITDLATAPVNITLMLNNTNYTSPTVSPTNNGTTYFHNYSKEITIPARTGNSTGIIQYWNWTYTIPEVATDYNTSTESINVTSFPPAFDHTATNWSDWHSTNISMDINCTDIDTITYNITNLGTINLSTPLTINGSNGLIYHDPTIYDAGNYAYNVSCGDGIETTTQVFNLTVKQNVLHSIKASKLALSEGEDIIFYLKVNITDLATTPVNISLMLNNTEYTSPTVSPTNNGTTYFHNYSKEITIPTGTGNATGIIQYWNWTYTIPEVATNYNTSTESINVFALAFDDCITYNEVILNLTLKDEENNTVITINSTIEIDLVLSSQTDTDFNWDYNNTWDDDSTIAVCIPEGRINQSSYTIDFTIGFSTEDHVQEFYYLDSGVLNTSDSFNSLTTKQINLMDLLTTDSTTFLFNYYDVLGLTVDDIIVHVFRKYIGEGVFREVERGKQDEYGDAHVHLVEEDVIYYFVVTQYGNLIYTSSTYNALCPSAPCTIILEESVDYEEFPTDWDLIEGGSYDITVSGRIVTLSFQLDSVDEMNLTIYEYSNNPNDIVSVASGALEATSGSIPVTIPQSAGNITFFAVVYKDNASFIVSEWVNLQEGGFTYFGTTGVILASLAILAFGLMAVTEGVPVILFLILGIIFTSILKLIELDWTALMLIIIAGGILVWKLTSRRTK